MLIWHFVKKCAFYQQLYVKRCLSLSIPLLRVDYYKVLGVSSTASADEIKKAYLQKCKEFHPDKHQGSKEMQAKFVQVNEAYTVLSNSAQRKEYEARSRYQKPSYYNRNSGPSSRPEDVFYQWQKSQQHHYYQKGFNNHQRWSRKDPLHDYWERVYKQQEYSRRDDHMFRGDKDPFGRRWNYANSNAYNTQKIIKQEQFYISLFIGFLLFIMFVRVNILIRNNRGNQIYPNSDVDLFAKTYPGSVVSDKEDLNLKTQDI